MNSSSNNNNIAIYVQAPDSIFGRLVSFFTKSEACHVFIRVLPNIYVEARLSGVTVFGEKEFKKRKIVKKYIYKFDSCAIIDYRVKVLEILTMLNYKKYDLLLTISHLFKNFIDSNERYNCIEVVKYVLDYLGIQNKIKYSYTPNDFLIKSNIVGCANWEDLWLN